MKHTVFAMLGMVWMCCCSGPSLRPHPCLEKNKSPKLPRTLEEAVDHIVSDLSDFSKCKLQQTERKDLGMYHRGWGMGIRNELGLWGGNPELLCDIGLSHPDDASGVIIYTVWKRVKRMTLNYEPDFSDAGFSERLAETCGFPKCGTIEVPPLDYTQLERNLQQSIKQKDYAAAENQMEQMYMALCETADRSKNNIELTNRLAALLANRGAVLLLRQEGKSTREGKPATLCYKMAKCVKGDVQKPQLHDDTFFDITWSVAQHERENDPDFCHQDRTSPIGDSPSTR